MGLSSVATAQVTFSIDWHSPTVSTPDSCTSTPITEGDILRPAAGAPAFGPLAPPCIAIEGGATGLGLAFFAGCVGHPPGTPCRIEVDALSYGRDYRMGQNTAMPGGYLFSTDEFAVAGVAPVLFPSISSEFPVGDSATDIWVNGSGLPLGPLPPFASPVGHRGVIDGDGLLSGSGALYRGVGLIEPTFPGPPPNTGDNLDAFDFNEALTSAGFPATGVFFSVDGVDFDVFSGVFNSGAAFANGVSPADILHTMAPGGPPVVWAPAGLLGLDLTGVVDDLDALAIAENGVAGFQPSATPYDWLTAAGPDMVLFSVRRGSAVIGLPDSIFGIPITEGDILTTPLPTGSGGLSPYPGIFCAAENIGLSTVRIPGATPDDLNALDTVRLTNTDCNGNGIDDFIDILNATSTDTNTNGIPDECEIIGGPGCFCAGIPAPCGNNFAGGGCRNSTGSGGILTATGSGSVSFDNLVLNSTSLPPSVFAIYFSGTTAVGPLFFGDGLRCAGPTIKRLTPPTLTSIAGTLSLGPGIASANGILPFTTRHFQCWYRDVTGPCATGFNITNSYTVNFTP